jgi:signal transduction histidine kinase
MARELLETLSPRNPARECVEIISDSSEHMLGLVSDILDFERIENNRLDLESIPFSILYEADKAITILSVAAKRKGINVDKVRTAHTAHTTHTAHAHA